MKHLYVNGRERKVSNEKSETLQEIETNYGVREGTSAAIAACPRARVRVSMKIHHRITKHDLTRVLKKMKQGKTAGLGGVELARRDSVFVSASRISREWSSA